MTAAADDTPTPDSQVAFDWLSMLYDHADDGWLTLFSLDRTDGTRHVDWFPIDNYDSGVEMAIARAATCDVWHGVATRRERLRYGRGGDADCAALPGLWLDIDIAGPGHKGGHALPPNVTAARQLIADFPLPPTAVVHSGGGLQAWWLFREPMPADDAPTLLARWGTTWADLGHRHGWHVDNVFDLARIMRLPGTLNRKVDQARPVVIIETCDDRYDPSDIDEWLIDPPAPPDPVEATKVPYIGPERPGDAFNAVRSGGDILRAAGWTLANTDRNGDQHWTRPGKDPSQGGSATVYAEDGHTTIWSDTVTSQHPTIETRRPYDAFGLFTHLMHRGDWRTASDALERQGYGTKARARDDLSWVGLDAHDAGHTADGPPDEADDDPDSAPGSSWRSTALGDLYDGIIAGTIDRPTPTVGRYVVGDLALYYPARVNGLYGESGKGKSWIALAIAAEILGDGGTVAWIDLEEPAVGTLQRLIDLGVDRASIVDRFLHFAPEESIRMADAMFAELDSRPPTLAVIDSTGEALTLEGAGPNNDDEVAAWFRSWPRRIANRYGACVVVIDHVVKDEQARGLFPGGSQRKRAAITGSAFMVDAVSDDKVLGKGAVGTLKLTCAKDRHGTHRQGQPAAEFTLDGRPDPQVWSLTAPTPPPSRRERLSIYMERVAAYLAAEDRWVPKAQLENAVQGKAASIREAVEQMVIDGYVAREQRGTSVVHRLIRPFNKGNDATRQMCA